MKFIITLITFFASVACAAAGPCYPTNNIYLPDGVLPSAIARYDYDNMLNKFEQFWNPQLALRGQKLDIKRKWADGTVNADTYPEGMNIVINAYGGFPRYPGMTIDAYQLVICHELGHHLGGAPHYSDAMWASVEGEGDYFSTLVCAKVMGMSAARIRAAAIVLSKSLARMSGDRIPSPSTPDRSVVRRTDENHPGAQCREDTLLNGLACPYKGPLSNRDPRVNSCYNYLSGVGVRPRCWFKP